jgi:hypothetical protein
MEGIAEAIKYLYQQFVLRDVVAYVAPGTILVASVLWVLFGAENAVILVRDLPAVAYLPLYGIVFVTGLGLENLGEMLGVLRFHNRRKDFNKRRNARRRREDTDHFRVLQEFHRATSTSGEKEKDDGYGVWLERTRERITIKKYASGNIAIAILVSMILLFLTGRRPDLKLWAVAFVGLILIASLLRAHWHQLDLQVIWEDEAVKPHEKDQAGLAQRRSGNNRAD